MVRTILESTIKRLDPAGRIQQGGLNQETGNRRHYGIYDFTFTGRDAGTGATRIRTVTSGAAYAKAGKNYSLSGARAEDVDRIAGYAF